MSLSSRLPVAALNGPAVPIIDISASLGGSLAERKVVAAQIDRACREIGFLIVSGHGVPEELVQRTETVTRAFFDLPDVVKRRYENAPREFRGFTAMGTSALAYSSGDMTSAPDYRELYTTNQPAIDPDDPYYSCAAGQAVFAPNVYPEEIPGLRETWIEYYQAMEGLALRIMRLFALALDLDEGFFDDKIDKHMTNFTVSNYPEQHVAPVANQLRAGAHSDWGSITILKGEDKPGGLEVLTKDGVWAPVPIIPGTFVVNIGDLMAQWTNDAWVSTVHRVVNPPPGVTISDTRRQSIVFFHQPNYDAMIECIPTCAKDRPAIYEPITSGAYLDSKMRMSYSLAS